MRGKPAEFEHEVGIKRITPADAGKTLFTGPQGSGKTDHPRGCGENKFITNLNMGRNGSPPRMRGKPLNPPIQRTNAQDHPRGCGENLPASTVADKIGGSPPRMRGKPKNLNCNPRKSRITPADAGKTTSQLFSRIAKPDHPRGCGENLCDNRGAKGYCGSPPRMRGKPAYPYIIKTEMRITPADAGKTR